MIIINYTDKVTRVIFSENEINRMLAHVPVLQNIKGNLTTFEMC